MFKHILVPLDGSELAEQALPTAVSLAEKRGIELTIVQVVAPPVGIVSDGAGYEMVWSVETATAAVREAERYLLNVAERWSPGASRWSTVVVEGDEAGGIVDTAVAEGCDLIIMSTHGRSGLSRWVLGSVAEKVLRAAPCPVLVNRTPTPIRQVLIPLDGSSLAEQALAPGLFVANEMGAGVHFLQSVEAVPTYTAEMMALEFAEPGLTHNVTAGMMATARNYLTQLGQRYPDKKIDTIVLAGRAPEAILQVAAEASIDLIVMATHGRTGLARWVYGSVTEKVLRRASCDLLVVRPPMAQLKE